MRRDRTMMMNFRAPALVDRQLIYLSGTECLGRVTVVCFLPDLEVVAGEKIDRMIEGFLSAGVRFLLVASAARPLHRVWSDRQPMPCAPIMGDPCGRLHRLFGVEESEPLRPCHTFVIDRAGALRLQFMHELSDHAFAAIRQLVAMDRNCFRERAIGSDTVSGEATCISM